MNYKKPNVLVAGFPRSGSTYIYQILKQHPEIFIPEIKEINYFNKDNFFLADPEVLNPRYFKSKNWYYNFFKTNKKVVMDFSILSALDVSSAKRVKDELGDIKILFITRNAKDYKKSILKMMNMWGESSSTVDKYLDTKFYIKNYENLFSKVYTFSIEKYNKNPTYELGKLGKFLDVKKFKYNLDVKGHETKNLKPIGSLQYYRRKIYIWIVKSFYKFLSLNVRSMAKAEKNKK